MTFAAGMAAAALVRLADYTAWAFQLPTIQLNVDVQDTFVLVEARMATTLFDPCYNFHKLRDTLSPMKLSAVKTWAREVGVDEDDLEGVYEEEPFLSDGREWDAGWPLGQTAEEQRGDSTV